MKAIQTSYGLAATIHKALSVADGAVEASDEEACQASQAGPPEGCLSVKVAAGTPLSRKKTRSQRRAKKRILVGEANGGVHKPARSVAQKRALSMVEGQSLTSTNAAKEDLKAAEGGWLGSRKSVAVEKESTLQELLESGLELVEWDGITPHALLDASDHVVAVLAGRARGTFGDVLLDATSEFERHSASLPPVEESALMIPKCKEPTRGRFHAVVVGISYGGGQPVPMQSAVPKVYQDAVNELRESKAVIRLAGFQNQAFKTFFPKIHEYYETSLSRLYRSFPRLQRPYESSIMPAAAYNLGPVTVCRPHRDSANLSFGICAITALGRFSPKTGGHLVLRELGLVAEFPPGATALIPSAIITHHNARVLEGETRYSFTQYAAGSLFSYIENGMRSEREVMEDPKLTSEEIHSRRQARRQRWGQGLALFPHVTNYARVP